jgi:hypothetical protein
LGTHPQLGASECLGLQAQRRPRSAEGGAVRRDAGDGDHARRRTADQLLQPAAALAQLVGGELRGARGGAAYQVRDADPARAQQVTVRVGHARRLVHRLGEDAGAEQRGVEAVDRVREVRLRRRGPQAGVDADEQ